ncbi:hypothetical protein [Chitinasiproducens palmae]|uniref:Uncharacterized protein n=1 Tax=Chitinasiproducens palmae TaxID=1770053 RepID=A0A1H2PSB2_9BURK|nr:hypothetical protein [Chitinasiproducens palmae]SDV49844.1 hypothetical protein SAMN05216551_109186 [Chitinasiproducens palmae]
MGHSFLMSSSKGSCWDCRHWRGGTAGGGTHTVCRQTPDQPQVRAQPEHGCAFWEDAPAEQKAALMHRRSKSIKR